MWDGGGGVRLGCVKLGACVLWSVYGMSSAPTETEV